MLKLIDDSNVCGRDLANDHVGYIDQCDYTYLGDLALLPRQKRINFRWCILEWMCLVGKGVDSWSLAGGGGTAYMCSCGANGARLPPSSVSVISPPDVAVYIGRLSFLLKYVLCLNCLGG